MSKNKKTKTLRKPNQPYPPVDDAPLNNHDSSSEAAAVPAPKLAVGEKFALAEADAEGIRALQQQVQTLHAALGERAEAYRREEMTLLQAIEKARAELTNAVKSAGESNGLEIGKYRYNFDNNSATFTRLA